MMKAALVLALALSCLEAPSVRAWVAPTNAHQLASPLPSISNQPWRVVNNPQFSRHTSSLTVSTSSDETKENSSLTEDDFKPSFYETLERDTRGRPIWKERKDMKDLKVGDMLEGHLVQEHLDGTTGPKLFLECGVGRYHTKKKTWKMVNAMLRLGHRGSKESVTKKRVARLKKKSTIECYVSRIRIDNRQLEVVLNPEDVPAAPKLVPVSSLKPGQEVVGKVQKLVPYGAFVDIGSNRLALLHIQKVADLYGSYIDKEKGLKESGIVLGDKIKVQIESNEKKRLFLDFTEEVKVEAAKDREEKQKQKEERQRKKLEWQKRSEERAAAAAASASSVATVASVGVVDAATASTETSTATSTTTSTDSDVADEEEDPYAEYAADYADDDYDAYDEERDIEDSLGLGTY